MSEKTIIRRSSFFPNAVDRLRLNAARHFHLRRAVVLLLIWPCLLSATVSALSEGGEAGICCWILIDIESFFCAPCLEPFLALCRALPARVQEERIQGILVYDAPPGGDRSGLRSGIVLKKWRAFRKAHDIRFPAAADAGRFFRGLLKGGIIVLLVHEERTVLACYPLPLQPGQLEEIVGILTGGAFEIAGGSSTPTSKSE